MYARFGKRACDLLGAALLLAALAPVVAAAALAVLATLGRPVLFRQLRAGQGGAPFVVLKLRTMRGGPGSDAERLTRFGRLLRASAVDELPQLVNVLRAEMSLVGPRPLPMAYVRRYSARQALRLAVRPGLAGPAQAAGRNAVGWAERLERDARYAEAPPRFLGDLGLLLRCAGLVATGRGVAAPGHVSMPEFAPERE